MRRHWMLTLFVAAASLAAERGEEIRLWPNGAPRSEGETAPGRIPRQRPAAQQLHRGPLPVDVRVSAAQRQNHRDGRNRGAWRRAFATGDEQWLMAHFAIRGLMHEAALKADEDPDRLSFLHAPYASIRRKIASSR